MLNPLYGRCGVVACGSVRGDSNNAVWREFNRGGSVCSFLVLRAVGGYNKGFFL